MLAGYEIVHETLVSVFGLPAKHTDELAESQVSLVGHVTGQNRKVTDTIVQWI